MHDTSQAIQWHGHVTVARPARRSTPMVSRRRKAIPWSIVPGIWLAGDGRSTRILTGDFCFGKTIGVDVATVFWVASYSATCLIMALFAVMIWVKEIPLLANLYEPSCREFRFRPCWLFPETTKSENCFSLNFFTEFNSIDLDFRIISLHFKILLNSIFINQHWACFSSAFSSNHGGTSHHTPTAG